MELRKYLTGAVAGAILVLCFLPSCLKEKICNPVTVYKDAIITKVETKRNTIRIPRFIQKTVTLSIPVAKVIDTTSIDTTYIYRVAKKHYPNNFTRKVYVDSVQVEKDVTVNYQANVTGTLNSMMLKYTDKRPQLVIHDSTTIEKEVLRDHSNGLYVGIGSSTAFRSLSPHLMYQDRKGNSYRVGVNALSVGKGVPEVSFGYSRKLW